jgi:tetratricopeptide (TPR) repeat protein
MTGDHTQTIIDAIGRGDLHAAEQGCRDLAHHGRRGEADYLLAVVRHGQGRLDKAAALIAKAAAAHPERADIAYNAGVILREAGRPAEAAAEWRRCLGLDHGHAGAMYNLALALGGEGEAAEAEALYAALLNRDPAHQEARFNLGNLLYRTGAFDRAALCFGALAMQEPQAARGLINYGMAMKALGRDADAEAGYRGAIAREPDSVQAHWNLANLLLSQGRWRDGLEEFEWRLRLPGMPRPDFGLPQWRPDAPPGTRVLLWNDHGAGDAIQFLRHVDALAERGQRVIVHVQDHLKRLAATVPRVEAAIGPGDPRPPADCHLPLLSLPFVLGLDLDASWRGPYLRAGTAFDPGRRPAVGLCWAGNAAHVNDSNRSLALAELAPLLAVEGITWVSLQAGPAARQLADGPWRDRVLAPPLGDFLETAAVVRGLDLVISVDTVVAHLAGALDVPCWVLLPAVGTDWRWGREGETTRWYPRMRLFRQRAAGAWKQPVSRMAEALR